MAEPVILHHVDTAQEIVVHSPSRVINLLAAGWSEGPLNAPVLLEAARGVGDGDPGFEGELITGSGEGISLPPIQEPDYTPDADVLDEPLPSPTTAANRKKRTG